MKTQIDKYCDDATTAVIRFRNTGNYNDYQAFASATESMARATDLPFVEVAKFINFNADCRQFDNGEIDEFPSI